LVQGKDGKSVFEVFHLFEPSHFHMMHRHGRPGDADRPGMRGMEPGRGFNWDEVRPGNRDRREERTGLIIFVGLNMEPIEKARAESTRHTVLMAAILLLIGFAGLATLFLAQAYRTTRTSLTRVQAFSDHVVENLPMGLVTVSEEGIIRTVNQSAQTLLGRTESSMVGRSAGHFLPEGLREPFRQLETRGKLIQKDVVCRLKDDQTLPLEISFSRLAGGDRRFTGYLLLFRDLTEVQALKKEVERNQRLASIGRLAAGVAHEIRNPLSSIKGFATYFRQRYREVPEDVKTADIMITEVDRLNRVISQLLEFARPLAVQKKAISPKIVIQHALKTIQAQAQEKGIEIVQEIPEENPKVPMDPDRMGQVLLNLFLNAMEAMPEGGVMRITLSYREARKIMEFTLSDTGTGIPPKNLAHVFDPYFTTRQSGTGLGLAIVHKIMESHKGEIKIESSEGQGTTVRLTLPLGS
jgi:two-component system sensor histidine kinase HydH